MTGAEFTIKQEALLSEIPKEFHSFVMQLAWDLGHSAGFDDVISYTIDIIEDLKPAIKAYTKFMRGE